MRKLLCLSLLSGLITGCNPDLAQENVSTISNYGHLPALKNFNKNDNFLIYFPKGRTYNVCLSRQMSEKLPGVESEIKAAINIWGYYIGRKLKIAITKVDMPTLSNEGKMRPE